MNLREAYKIVIKNEIEVMIEEKGANIPEDQIDKLVEYLHDNYDFLQGLTSYVEDNLDMYCENIDIFDIWG